MSEEDFRDRLILELTKEPAPPLGALVSAAAEQGVKLRRRHRIVQVAAGTAGVTAVAFAATAVAGGIGSGHVSPVSAAADATTPGSITVTASAAVPAKPSISPAAPTTGPATTVVAGSKTATTAQSLIALLQEDVTSAGGPGTFSHTFAYAYRPGQPANAGPAGDFNADLYWNHSTIAVRYSSPGQNPKTRDKESVSHWDTPGSPDASEVKLRKSARGVEIDRPDGSKVIVLEINGPETGSTGPDRADLPLTPEQLYQIASDPRWGATMDAAFVARAEHTVTLAADPF